jgi:DNA-binding transcriptional MocR family regulator
VPLVRKAGSASKAQVDESLWCHLPDDLDAADSAREALAEDIVLLPGNAFSLAQSARSFLRFNVAQSLDERLYAVLRVVIQRQRSVRR